MDTDTELMAPSPEEGLAQCIALRESMRSCTPLPSAKVVSFERDTDVRLLVGAMEHVLI
jgi:hypothetical protein